MTPEESAMREQTSMLREMRDAMLRSGSATPPGGPYQMPASPMGGGAAFVQARTAMDQAAIGQWATLGWSSAYRSQIHSSLFNDAFGAAGLRRSPNSMTQLEYQHLAADMTSQRLAGLPGYLLAPTFSANSAALGDDLFAYSTRFRRAGDANAGAFGTGMSFSAANQLGREISVRAAGDLRLSPQDYHTVLRTGLSTGQFDYTRGGNDELTSKLRELTSAVGDLTRVTRASVSDISSAMGNLRQAGVVDVGDQRRIIENLSASARVAGLTFGEVAPAAGAAIQAGLGMGLSAAASAGAYGANIAHIRGVSRSGILHPTLLAAAGGTGELANAITAAGQRVAGSDVGLLALAGGGRDYYSSALSAAGALNNPINALNLRYRKPEALDGIGEDGINNLLDQSAMSTVKLMGVNDISSEQGLAAAASYFESLGMTPSQAYAAAKSRFSTAGRREAAMSRANVFGDRARAARALNADAAWMDSSLAGRVQGVLSGVRQGAAELVNEAQGAVSLNQGGWFGKGGRFNQDAFMIGQGAMLDPISTSALVAQLSGGLAPAGDTTRVLRGGSRWGAVGAMAGGAVGTGVGAMFGGGLFSVATATAGGLGGAALGGYVGGLFDTPTMLSAGQSAAFDAMVSAQSSTGAGRGRELLSGAVTSRGTRITDDHDFNQLIRQTHGRLTGADAVQHADRVARIAERHGLSHQEVAGAARAAGQRLELPDSYLSYGGTDNKAVDDIFNSLLGSGMSSDIKADVNFASSEGRKLLIDAVSDYTANNGLSASMRGRLSEGGIAGEDLSALASNIGRLGADERSTLVRDGSKIVAGQQSAAINRAGGVAYDYLNDLLARAERGHVGGTASARRQLEGVRGNTTELLRGLTGGGSLSAFRGLATAMNDPLLMQTLSIESGVALQQNISRGNFTKYAGLGFDQATLQSLAAKGDSSGEGLRMAIAHQMVMGSASSSSNPDRLISTASENQRMTAQILQTVAQKLGIAKAEPAK